MLDFDLMDIEETPQARQIAAYFRTFYPNVKTVIDFGCGPGTYVRAFRELGIESFGIDIDERVSGKDFLQCIDVLAYQIEKKVDLAVCLEVAEHLSPESASALVDKIAEASDFVLFSAAHPGQGGDGHINCQPKAYWIQLFESKGYRVDENVTSSLIEFVRGNSIHAMWFVINAMILAKTGG